MSSAKKNTLGGSSSGSVEFQNRQKQSKSKSSAIPIKKQKTSLKIGQKIIPHGILDDKKDERFNEPGAIQRDIACNNKEEEIVDAFFGNPIFQMPSTLALNFPTHLFNSQEGLCDPNQQLIKNGDSKKQANLDSQDILSKMQINQAEGVASNFQGGQYAGQQQQFEKGNESQENILMDNYKQVANSNEKQENLKGGSLECQSSGQSSNSPAQLKKINKNTNYPDSMERKDQNQIPNVTDYLNFTFQKSNDADNKQGSTNEQVIGKRGTDSEGAADNGIKLKRNLSSDLQKNQMNGNNSSKGQSKITSQTGQQNQQPQKASYGAAVRKNGKYSDDYDDVSQDCSQKDGKKLIMLGRGGFGQVFLIRQKGGSGEERAMKIVLKSFQEAYREVMMLKKFSHPNVLKIYEYFEDDQSIYVITERCYGYNLFDYIILKGQFSEQQTCKIADGVLRALSEAHKQGIVHRDVKPDNIMLDFNDARDSFVVKLIDWGLAEQIPAGENKFLTKRCGTLHYLAPEVLAKHYNEKVDLWSLGMVLYTLIQGSPPICGRSQQEVLGQVKDFTCNFRYYCWKNVSDEAKDLILKLLERDQTKRISAKEALSHPWFQKFDNTTPIDTQDLRLSYDNLLKYAQQNTFKKTVLGFFASHTISKRERAKYIEIFQTLDTDKNGELSVEELKKGFSKLFGDQEYNVCHTEIEQIFFQSLSSRFENASGIKYEEFLSSMLACSATYSKDQLMDAFKLFDKDGNGKITLQEIVQTLGIGESEELILSFKEIIEQFDSNNDGQIDFEEFRQIMTNFLDKHSQSILSQEMYLQ